MRAVFKCIKNTFEIEIYLKFLIIVIIYIRTMDFLTIKFIERKIFVVYYYIILRTIFIS